MAPFAPHFHMTRITVLFFYQVFLLSLNISLRAYKEIQTGNLPKSDPLRGPSSETKQDFSSRKQEGVWLSLLVKVGIANHHPPIRHLAYVHLQAKNRGLMWKAKVMGWMNTLVSCRQVGGECKISPESSLRRCRTPDGLICSGRGECECGICICQVTEPRTFYGPRCECHDWICPTYDGKTCGGKSCLILSQHSIPAYHVSISGDFWKKRLCRCAQDTHPASVKAFDVPSNIVSLATRSHLNFTVLLFRQIQAVSKEPVWVPCCSVAALFFLRFCRHCFKGSFSPILPVLNVISVVSTGWWVCAKFI